MVCKSFPAATATWKIENPNIDMTKGNLRPRSSLNGAQNVGPRAKPKTYSERPSNPTSVETWYCAATVEVAVEKILEVNAAIRVVYPSITAVRILQEKSIGAYRGIGLGLLTFSSWANFGRATDRQAQ